MTRTVAEDTATVGEPSPTVSHEEKVPRRQVDKFAERRAELASAAFLTLAELGYARTSLREIAQNSDFSHGVLHYYFRDKQDLILETVRQYKEICVRRYDAIFESATDGGDLRHDFAVAMAGTLRDDAKMHRLWYDLRIQAFFQEALWADVVAIDAAISGMVWRAVTQIAELDGQPLTVTQDVAYGIFDGLFQQHLFDLFRGRDEAPQEYSRVAEQLLYTLIPRP